MNNLKDFKSFEELLDSFLYELNHKRSLKEIYSYFNGKDSQPVISNNSVFIKNIKNNHYESLLIVVDQLLKPKYYEFYMPSNQIELIKYLKTICAENTLIDLSSRDNIYINSFQIKKFKNIASIDLISQTPADFLEVNNISDSSFESLIVRVKD